MSEYRPDPDQLLEEIQRDEAQATRGRLKIFFGGCAGVGKTWAMLAAAQAKVREGAVVVAGVVETHGRAETAAMLAGLQQLPPRHIEYRGKRLPEFDLDSALLIKPALMLIDEFAHSNVPGSRHPKRWQDVEELLSAGIDVYTTLNVQHLESLNDIVGQITGIVVRETVPDRVFDAADEVTLVDLPPDELLARLQAGKVYLPQQAERATQHFFRKGNLLALRELALRRTADRVDAQMRAYRADQSIRPVWQARERLLVCVGPGNCAEKLVRSGARLAASLHADWLAIYVETPALQRQGEAERARTLKALKLAQELGAETSVLAGVDLPATLLAYAQSRNASKLVVGKSQRGMLHRLWRQPLSERLAHAARDVDVYVVAHELDDGKPAATGPARSMLFDTGTPRRKRYGIVAALAACGITSLIAAGLVDMFDLANVAMLYLLAVVLVAVRFGRRAGALAAVTSVGAFDFFFVPPRMSLRVSDTQYLLTFVVMLAVALIIGQLAARLRFEATVATYRERRTRALYELGRELAGALTAPQVVEIGARQLAALFQSDVQLFVPDSMDKLQAAGEGGAFDAGLAQWAFDHQQPAGLGTHTLPASVAHYLPLRAPMRVRGVLALIPRMAAAGAAQQIFQPEQQRLLETCASQIALSLERVHYVEVAQDAIVAMEAERLRNGVLSAVSHDLRTPLTSLLGLASLLEAGHVHGEQQQELTTAIRQEAERMNRLVINLLDMARLQSGVKLNKAWQLLDEVIGSAARAVESVLLRHVLKVALPADLPMLAFDAVLIERVFVNLLENAAKYTPPGSVVTIAARHSGGMIEVTVSDDGPGLPAGRAEQLFAKFARGESESATPGVGLGLAICRTIIEAHGGTIQAHNLAPDSGKHGAAFTFTLPAGNPPALPEA
ncbi:Sensor protein KdpD [Andreprevotia sp. IGB-42]|uniref:sensor histidine kinase n=1 Tax=Andreprevotia sp. IGB-42 TaxID=2497473 RepID=UPI00135BC3C7|nr:sensor histidine kinase KdpD [Andreprevotia sp. IGB-42]KAF0815079.1 Sensor protein KdpD [Andreprevotia sp. IGB-42]